MNKVFHHVTGESKEEEMLGTYHHICHPPQPRCRVANIAKREEIMKFSAA